MPTKDAMMSVDDMMLTCMEIMMPGAMSPDGEDLLAIGVWEAPIKRLAMKEYVVKIGNGYRITEKGKEFFAQSEGTSVEALMAAAPVRPDWIVTDLPDNGGLVVLRKNDMTVSGYEALAARWVPVIHGRMNEPDTVAVRSDVNGFLQTVLDAAWAKGLRPTAESIE